MAESSQAAEKRKPIEPVLQLVDLGFQGTDSHALSLREANLKILPGRIATVCVPHATETRSFVSMLQGVGDPIHGRVLIQGSDWKSEDFVRLDQMRSQIGRVYEGTAWIENLNIYENIVLSQRHHSIRTIDDIDREVDELARELGIDAVTTQRPGVLGPTYLKVCQWIRAFMGKPKLLLLEEPMRSVPTAYQDKIVARLIKTLQRGASALWLSQTKQVHSLEIDNRVDHYDVKNQRIQRAA